MPIQHSMLPSDDLQHRLANRWLWFLILGVGLAVLGITAIANSLFATVVSLVLFGWMLVIAGIIHLGHAIRIPDNNPGLFHLFLSILYLAAAVVALQRPLESATSLTLLFSVFLIACGIARAAYALWVRNPGFEWELGNGAISLVLGLLILTQWPSSGLWMIGLFVGITLLIDGLALVAFSFILKPWNRMHAGRS